MYLIKRYSNRKLYNTTTKKYVVMEEIADLVKEGQKIQIIDNETQEDITASILSQFITEQTRKNRDFSPSLFIQMIKKGSEVMYDYTCKIAQTIGETAYNLEEGVEDKVKKLISSGDLTKEEGTKITKVLKKYRAVYSHKIEENLVLLMTAVLKKLNIPTKTDMDKIKSVIDKLEKRIEKIEKKFKEHEGQEGQDVQATENKEEAPAVNEQEEVKKQENPTQNQEN